MSQEELRLEYLWIVVVVSMLSAFIVSLVYVGIAKGFWTPEEVVTCDVKRLDEFIKPSVKELEPGVYEVNIVARRWFFDPGTAQPIVLENPKKIIFRITSADYIHGFEIVGTPVNVMVFPGYIAEVEWIPPKNLKGEFLILCNEYCGVGHSNMKGLLIIER